MKLTRWRVAAVAAALGLSLAPPALGGAPRFEGPTIKNPSVPPDFALRDQSGQRVQLGHERGHVVLLTFLYTHCPDVCPLTADHLNQVLRALGPQRARVRVLAVTVDPRGDTPAAVRRFVRAHELLPQFRYLTGPAAPLLRLWAAYSVGSTPRGGGHVDHTLYTLLLDRSLRGRVLYDSTAKPAAILHDVRILLG